MARFKKTLNNCNGKEQKMSSLAHYEEHRLSLSRCGNSKFITDRIFDALGEIPFGDFGFAIRSS